MKLSIEDLEKINNLLAKQTSITDQDLCFCGSGQIYQTCCSVNIKYWITDDYLNKLIGFAKNKSFNVDGIPTTFLLKLESYFQGQFDMCATKGCSGKGINSHVFGKALLEKYFNSSQCQWYSTGDSGAKDLVPVGIRTEMGYKIFCQKCDNDIFLQIDDVNHDITNPQNQLLHLFRALAYQHQFNRLHLAIAHQLIYAIPAITEARSEHTGVIIKNQTINITHFKESYIRYQLTDTELQKLHKVIDDKNASNPFTTISRIVSSKQPFFAQGIDNSKYDFNGDKIIFSTHAALLYVILPYDSKHVQIIFSSQYKEYSSMLEQMKTVNEYRLKKFVNTLLQKKNSPRGIFVGLDQKYHQKILR